MQNKDLQNRMEFFKTTSKRPLLLSYLMVLFSVLLWTSCTKNPDGTITVTTKSVTDITESSAKTGGSVTSSGYSIGDCGVCYGESHNPTLNNSFTKDHEGDGSFSSILNNLKSSTTYYVRAYAKTSSGVEYGDEKTFKTLGNGGGNGGGGGSGSGYTINVFANPTAGGTVTGAGTYQSGKSCTVTATANTGYTFTNWKENGAEVSSDENYTFTVTGSRNLTANFSLISYSVTASVAPDNSGTVSGGGEYNHGQSCTLRATANAGFSFTNWTENGEVVSNNASYAFPVTGNRTLVANFEIQTYTISITANPSNGGTVSGGGSNFTYGQNCTVTATANANFAFIKWTENGNTISTDANYTFIVSSDRNLVANFEGAFNGHGYVDLGLPSGTLWATCNVGATTPESYGDYFAWGETTPKSNYNSNTYKYFHNGYTLLTKYCNDPTYGYNGFTDNLTILLPEDDAATANWGTGWSTPSYDEWLELIQYTSHFWTTQNGVNGHLFTSNNGNSIFLPAAGLRANYELIDIDDFGYYWSKSLAIDPPYDAKIFQFWNSNYFLDGLFRDWGLSVRPVRSNRQN